MPEAPAKSIAPSYVPASNERSADGVTSSSLFGPRGLRLISAASVPRIVVAPLVRFSSSIEPSAVASAITVTEFRVPREGSNLAKLRVWVQSVNAGPKLSAVSIVAAFAERDQTVPNPNVMSPTMTATMTDRVSCGLPWMR